MSRFGGIGEANQSKGGTYFQEGTHKVEITKIDYVKSQTNNNEFFVIEAEVLESDTMRPGIVASQLIKMHQQTSLGNIQNFFCALAGIDASDKERIAEEITEDVVEAALTPEQPCAGEVLILKCQVIQTKAKTNFTKHTWKPCEE